MATHKSQAKPLTDQQFLESLAFVVKEKRTACGLSHDKLADIAGVTRPTISYIESCKQKPTITTCYRLANALGVSLSELIREVEER